jgi:spore germination protein KC
MGRWGLFILVICLFLVPILLSGCYDRQEIDNMVYILALGFDKGKQDRLMLTVQYATFKEPGGGEKEKKELGQVDSTLVESVEAPSIYTGLNMLSVSTSRRFNLTHAKYLVFSKELAQSPMLEYYVNGLIRYAELRRIMYFMVARQNARDFILENQSLIGESPYKSIELKVEQAQYSGFFPMTNLREFYDGTKSTYYHPVAMLVENNSFKAFEQPKMQQAKVSISGGEYLAGEIPRTGGEKGEAMGAAVFRGPKMVGEITGEQNRLLMMVKGELKRGFFTIIDPKDKKAAVVLDVRLSRKPSIRVNVTGDKPRVDVDMLLEGNIVSIQSKINYESLALKPQLEKALEMQIKTQLDRFITKCQEEFKADIFGFGWYGARHFATIQKWESYAWLDKFPDAEVNTRVKFNIRRSGLMLKTSPGIE